MCAEAGKQSISRVLYPLARAGDLTETTLIDLSIAARTRLEQVEENLLAALGDALAHWPDSDASKVLKGLEEALEEEIGNPPDLVTGLTTWVQAHPDEVESVRDCLFVQPPAGIKIRKLLSRAGGQKVVFLAEWPVAGRLVVVKKLIGPVADQAKILLREAQAHPLSISHPNIIETHTMTNEKGDVFLVEEFLSEILGDAWKPQGLEEAATLLFDISSAISFLHRDIKRVHADIKPDNLGRRGDSFVLLDFGMCRPLDQLAEATATGSLRTRAPEVLKEAAYAVPDRVDVWALGAVVFNAYEDRFPLFDAEEKVPPVVEVEARQKLVEILKERAASEWDKRLQMERVPTPLQSVLNAALTKDPEARPTAQQLREMIVESLFVYLRSEAFDAPMYSASEEIAQYERWLLRPNALALNMPLPVKQKLKARLNSLRSEPEIGIGRDTIDALLAVLQ